MLSNISSFLSEKLEKLDLHDERVQAPPTAQNGPDEDNDEGKKGHDLAEGVKREKKKKSTSHETFIIVRPPPAKNNHPLNLQIQLVPAQHSRDRSNTSSTMTPTNSRISVDLSRTDTAAQLPPSSPSTSETDHQHDSGVQRSGSMGSNRSDSSTFYASASSAGSVSSFASTASSSSGRRMIIPLYNLSAHNVMTNTVLDAGTDAKVAKFLKRGIEIIGLAVLEPVEVWNGDVNPVDIPIQRSPSGNSLAPPPLGQGASIRAATPDLSQHSPGSSKLSLSSEHSSPPPEPVAPSVPLQTGAKKIFGRMFRKKEGSGSGHTRTASDPPIEAMAPVPVPEVRTPASPPRHEILLPPVLGLTPTTAHPPSGRCVAHVWMVQRWLKTENQGLLSGVIGKISREVSMSAPESAAWEVRFEWARGRSKTMRARKRVSIEVTERQSHTQSRRSSALVAGGEHRSEDEARQSMDVSAGAHPPPPVAASDDGSMTSAAGDDPGNESDPEDSETPWTCTLVLAHPHHPIAPHSREPSHSRRPSSLSPPTMLSTHTPQNHGPEPPQAQRLKIATLSPAPHHPKVVCQLRVPFPLPDVEVDHGIVRKRVVQPDGTTLSTVPRERPGLVLTAEEIKDVVCSTAFWVVVRQAFGGIGKKTRKGDGWRIRA